MKIIVDEMPKESKDCIFIGYMDYECKISGTHCELFDGKCNKLKPITDYHAEKVIEQNSDGCIAERFRIR